MDYKLFLCKRLRDDQEEPEAEIWARHPKEAAEGFMELFTPLEIEEEERIEVRHQEQVYRFKVTVEMEPTYRLEEWEPGEAEEEQAEDEEEEDSNG